MSTGLARDTCETSGAERPQTHLQLPADPRGAALTRFIHQGRLAIARGDVVVDSTVTASWSPGQRLVLDRLRQVAERAGRHWHDSACD